MIKRILFILSVVLIGLSSCQKHSSKEKEVVSNPEKLNGDQVYSNPVDGKTYNGSNGWKRHHTEADDLDGGPIKLKTITMLTGDPNVKKRMGIDENADFAQIADRMSGLVRKVKEITIGAFKSTQKKGEMMIQLTLTEKPSPEVSVSFRDDVEESRVSKVYNQLEKITGYSTLEDSVKIQFHFLLNKEVTAQ